MVLIKQINAIFDLVLRKQKAWKPFNFNLSKVCKFFKRSMQKL